MAADNYVTEEVASVDLTSTGQTTVYTVPTGKRFIPRRLMIVTDSIAGVSGMPTCQAGTSGDPDLLKEPRKLTQDLASAGGSEYWDDLESDALAAGTEVQFGVTLAGASATHTATLVIEGLLINE